MSVDIYKNGSRFAVDLAASSLHYRTGVVEMEKCSCALLMH